MRSRWALCRFRPGCWRSGWKRWTRPGVLAFHIVGTVMELFKTAVGSWQYPDQPAAHRRRAPVFRPCMPPWAAISRASGGSSISASITTRHAGIHAAGGRDLVNFSPATGLPDIRPAVRGDDAAVPAHAHLVPRVARRPLDAAAARLVSVAAFIWFAENIATFSRAWIYPRQTDGWSMVGPIQAGRMASHVYFLRAGRGASSPTRA
jgi:uncharacterized membrane protein YoaT (DUF817 family)